MRELNENELGEVDGGAPGPYMLPLLIFMTPFVYALKFKFYMGDKAAALWRYIT